MGKTTRQKQEELFNADEAFKARFSEKAKELEAKLAVPLPHVSEDFKEFEGFFVRPKETFSLKTKSKDRNKQRLEFVRHAFHLFPVPAFMFEAWETPRPRMPIHRYDYSIQAPNYGFRSTWEYRLWYICMATGGSFYKEYGKALFTKKESHIFLNCKHNISIPQAIVYSIAYAESGDMGKSLRIASSKINELKFTTFWRDVIRFFSHLEIESKEQVSDIVDYIIYKRAEDPNFTIVGRGHTLKSILKKVEDWHQDLRRLKIIGDNNWEGVPVSDREYKYKNSQDPTKNDVWKFTQIKSAKELQKEGNRMRHCVLGYKQQCIDGKCSIWSLTVNDDKKLTIEVQRNQVMQVRGLANRIARAYEKNIVSRWARDSGFSYI